MAERSQLLRGVTDLLVLSALSSGRSYGYELVERLQQSTVADVNEATVYATLRRLEAAGFLSSRLVRSSGGPARRYYELTESGRAALATATREWRQFVGDVDAFVGTRPKKARSAS
jgi:PadR family transcriptional regulator PadR